MTSTSKRPKRDQTRKEFVQIRKNLKRLSSKASAR